MLLEDGAQHRRRLSSVSWHDFSDVAPDVTAGRKSRIFLGLDHPFRRLCEVLRPGSTDGRSSLSLSTPSSAALATKNDSIQLKQPERKLVAEVACGKTNGSAVNAALKTAPAGCC